mgnify:CR=1 FL=1
MYQLNVAFNNLIIDFANVEEVDIHTYNQEQFGVPTRDIAKRLLYGMLYGCGAAKAGTIIDPNEKELSASDCRADSIQVLNRTNLTVSIPLSQPPCI